MSTSLSLLKQVTRKSRNPIANAWAARLLVIFTFLMLWELVALVGVINPLFFPPPTAVAVKLVILLTGTQIWVHLWVTATRLLLGYCLGAVLGMGLGVLLGGLRYPRGVFMPYVVLLFSLPKIAVFPLFILWFGMDMNLYVAYAAVSGMFPILLNTVAGFREVRQSLVLAARSMGASPLQIFLEVVLPTIVPMLFAGLRMGMNFAILGVIIAELIVSKHGVGFIINRATYAFRSDELYAIVVLVVLLVTTLNEGLRVIENRMSVWREG